MDVLLYDRILKREVQILRSHGEENMVRLTRSPQPAARSLRTADLPDDPLCSCWAC